MAQSITQAAPSVVTASDGVALAVHAYSEIDKRRPTILAIHGSLPSWALRGQMAPRTANVRRTPWAKPTARA